MAKKRAMVDASLSAGRLSNIFTQDMEDKAVKTAPAKQQVSAPAAAPSKQTTIIVSDDDTEWPDNDTPDYVDGVWLQDNYKLHGKKMSAWLLEKNIPGYNLTEKVGNLTAEQAKAFVDYVNLLEAGK